MCVICFFFRIDFDLTEKRHESLCLMENTAVAHKFPLCGFPTGIVSNNYYEFGSIKKEWEVIKFLCRFSGNKIFQVGHRILCVSLIMALLLT